MIRKIFVVVFFALLFQCMASNPAAANPCSTIRTGNDLGFDLGLVVPPWAVLVSQNTTLGLAGLSLYAILTNACAPAPTRQCQEVECSSPINVATGDTYIHEVDVKIPGIGGGLTLTRTWNSMWPASAAAHQVGLFGPNWSSTFEEKIFVGTDHYVKYLRGDGVIWSFGFTGGLSAVSNWSPAAPLREVIGLQMAPLQSTLTSANGEVRTFDPSTGNLLSITDRNSNITQLTYDSSNRLVTVTDPASRHLYFGYANGSSFLVTSVTSDFGISLSYAYDAQGRLIQVTKPDATTVSFTYNSQSMITTVTDSVGKVLESHTYDSSGRGLTGSKAGGAEAVTLSY